MKPEGSGREHGATTRRRALRTILASGAAALAARGARAQWASTPEDAGQRPGIRRAVELPNATDLAADAAASAKGGLPILLFFERDACPYCERALREYLVPFARNEWKGKAIFRQVGIDRTLPVRDFDGRPTSHQAIAARLEIIFSPTVLVVDGRGRALAEPIVGLTILDFYGAYVNDALSKGARKLRA